MMARSDSTVQIPWLNLNYLSTNVLMTSTDVEPVLQELSITKVSSVNKYPLIWVEERTRSAPEFALVEYCEDVRTLQRQARSRSNDAVSSRGNGQDRKRAIYHSQDNFVFIDIKILNMVSLLTENSEEGKDHPNSGEGWDPPYSKLDSRKPR